MLHRAQDDRHATMDPRRDTHGPSIAIDVARPHLDSTRRPAVEVCRHLDAAHQDTAHIAAADLRWIEARSDGYASPAECEARRRAVRVMLANVIATSAPSPLRPV